MSQLENLDLSKNTLDGLEFTDDEKNRFREYVIQRVIEINEKYKNAFNGGSREGYSKCIISLYLSIWCFKLFKLIA